MKLSPKRMLILAFAIFVVIGLLIGAFSVATQVEAFSYLFFGWVIVGSFLIYRIRCPKCGSPVALQEKGVRFPLFAGLTVTKCQSCGEDLTRAESSS